MSGDRLTIRLDQRRNPDAAIVAAALAETPERKRSAALLRWAAAYLSGEQGRQAAVMAELTIDEEEIDSLLDDF